MLFRARRIAVYAVVAALAVGNGFTPRHAQAASGHVDHSQAATMSHHGEHASHSDDVAGKAGCHDDTGRGQSQAFPDNNCCVASCAAVAFIFATIAFDSFLPRESYLLPPPRPLTPATLIGDDPPPR